MSDRPGQVDFAIGLVNSVLNLPHGQVKFFEEFKLGCSRKNPHPHDGWDSGNSRGRGGSKTPEIQAGGGVDLKKVFCRGHFDR